MTAMSRLDLAMERWIEQHAEVKRLVGIVYQLLVTDDEDESLRFDPDADNMVRISI